MPQYEVHVVRTLVSRITQSALITVEADSEDEARKKAERLAEKGEGDVVWMDQDVPEEDEVEELSVGDAEEIEPEEEAVED